MSKHPDDFGDRMKDFESREAKRTFLPMLPIVARIDGRSFSKFTRPFQKPFDDRLSNAMQETTKALVDHTHARIGYTQSDEITLIFLAETYDSQVFFGGRIQKLASVLASMTTAHFIRSLDIELDDETDQSGAIAAELGSCTPHFDCRVWQVPNKMEAANTLLWRAQDARKNGISSACRSMCSAKSMHGKDQSEMVQMMLAQGTDYYETFDLDDQFGTFWQRQSFQTELDDDTWNTIPLHVRDNMDRTVTRSRVINLELGYFGDYENRVEIIFDKATPQLKEKLNE